MLSGHSPSGWNKVVSKSLKTLVSRGEDISDMDLNNVTLFLQESLDSLQKIRIDLPKHRKKNK
jgi:hypothetical protein